MIKVVGIKFEDGGRIYYFSPNHLNILDDSYVIVETERGIQFGQATTGILEKNKEEVFLPLKDIIRIATEEDIKKNKKNKEDSKKALEFAKELVTKDKMNMKLFEANYTFDRKKLVFKFIADARVDFRELAKELAAKYKTRIELRQIGARDKAKEISGLGPCGRPLCCSEFLTNFDGISINMAKNQGLALNPTKINGACGRLLCCLGYEDEVYTNYKKNMPKYNELIDVNGKKGRVCELDILQRKYKVKFENNEVQEVMVNDNGSNK